MVTTPAAAAAPSGAARRSREGERLSRSERLRWAGLAAALMAGLGGCGGSSSSSSPEATAAPSSSPSPGALVRHVDPKAGFSIVYPAAWHFYQTPDPGVQLRVGPDGSTSASVRLVASTAPSDSAGQLTVVHQLLEAVKLVDETPVTVHGLSGWQEVYGVQSGATSLVHIHVFLFEPNRLDTIVFETPVSSLGTYAPTFDLMRSSFQAIGGASPTAGAGGLPTPPA